MRVIIIYDVNIERIDNVRKILKQYLSWIQNSAFEGELSRGMLEELKVKLYEIIEPTEDSIIVYAIENSKWLNKDIWGVEKGNTENIL
jgi:CRISPR-associated protein Cas2